MTTVGGPVWLRQVVTLEGRPRGFHLVTRELVDAVPELSSIGCGVLQVFIQHTTASLTVNEDIDPAVLDDFRSWFDESVPERRPYWTHTYEGPADMPAHIKTSLLGPSVMVPVGDGRPLLGRYQGIYLCEHVDTRNPRTLVLTAWGEGRATSVPGH
jgi:secondary thiamine-phosphate synthase enzyme